MKLFRRSELKRALKAGRRLGVEVAARELDYRPLHWRRDYFGFAARRRNGKLVAEVAWLKGADISDGFKALCLWHELGHTEQYLFDLYGDNPTPGEERWLFETDAWDRGLTLAGEAGCRIAKADAKEALSCLTGYIPAWYTVDRVMEAPAVQYLAEIAGVRLQKL